MRNNRLDRMRALERCDYTQQREFCGVVLAVAAIAGVGLTAYGMATAPGAPSVSAPPPPPNSVQYDEDGNIMSRQVFNAEKNEWITYGPNSEPEKPKEVLAPGAKPNRENYVHYDETGQVSYVDDVGYNKALTNWQNQNNAYSQYQKDMAEYKPKYDEWVKNKEERAAEKAKLAELRSTAIGNLNEASPERKAQIEKFGTAFADSMHRDLDPRYEKTVRAEEEAANARGMFGSRAYVDTKAELETVKANQDTDIANQASMAKETLLNNDRTYWANLVSQIDSGARSDLLTQAQVNKANADITTGNYAGTLGYYSALNNNRLADFEARRQKSAAFTQAGSGLANGLLYLYGGMGKTPTASIPGSGSGFGVSSLKPATTGAGTFSLFG